MLESEFECEFACGFERGFECGFEFELGCLRCVTALEFEFESSRSSLRACVPIRGFAFEFESEFKCVRQRSSLSSSAGALDRARVKVRVRAADGMLSKTPPRNVLGGTSGPRSREHSQAPGKDPENDHL